MKIKGRRAGVNEEPVVIPRAGEDFVILMKAVEDASVFEDMCPKPQPPARMLSNGEKILNHEDPNYKKSLDAWAEKKTAWYVIKSIEAGTEGIEWEKVDLSDHTTWSNYKEDLKDFGLSEMEINLVISGMMKANGLSELALQAARERFLASRQVRPEK